MSTGCDEEQGPPRDLSASGSSPCCPALVSPSPTHRDPASPTSCQPCQPQGREVPSRPGLAAEQRAELGEVSSDASEMRQTLSNSVWQ